MRLRSGSSAAVLLLVAGGGVALLLHDRSASSESPPGPPNAPAAPAADPLSAQPVGEPADPPESEAVNCGTSLLAGPAPELPPPPSFAEAMQLVESTDPEDRRRAFEGIRVLVTRLDELEPEEAARVRDFVISLLRSPEVSIRMSAVEFVPELGEPALPAAAALLAEGALPPDDVLHLVTFLLASDRCFEFLSLDDETTREYVLKSLVDLYGGVISSRGAEILLTTRRDVLRKAEPAVLEGFADAARDVNRIPEVLAFLHEAELTDFQRLALLKGLWWNSDDEPQFAEQVRQALPRIRSAHVRQEVMQICVTFDDEPLLKTLLRERLAVEPNEWLRLQIDEWLDELEND